MAGLAQTNKTDEALTVLILPSPTTLRFISQPQVLFTVIRFATTSSSSKREFSLIQTYLSQLN